MVNAEPASPQVAPLEADAQAHLNAVYQEVHQEVFNSAHVKQIFQISNY